MFIRRDVVGPLKTWFVFNWLFLVIFMTSIFTDGTLYGPLHTKEAVDMYLRVVDEAKQQGGVVEYGGKVSPI